MKTPGILLAVLTVSAFAEWELTDKTNHLTDIPSTYDFMPLGVTAEETADHQILYPSADPKCSFR